LGIAAEFLRNPDDPVFHRAGSTLRDRSQGANACGHRETFYSQLNELEQIKRILNHYENWCLQSGDGLAQ